MQVKVLIVVFNIHNGCVCSIRYVVELLNKASKTGH